MCLLEEHKNNLIRGEKELSTISWYVFFISYSFENGISIAEPFHKELDNPVCEVSKEHERESCEKSKSATKLCQKRLKGVELHLKVSLTGQMKKIWNNIDHHQLQMRRISKFIYDTIRCSMIEHILVFTSDKTAMSSESNVTLKWY